MKKPILLFTLLIIQLFAMAKNGLTPETMWQLGRVSVAATSPDNAFVLYAVSHTSLKDEKTKKQYLLLNTKTLESAVLSEFTDKKFIQWSSKGMYFLAEDRLELTTDMGRTFIALQEGIKEAIDLRISPDEKWLAYSKTIPVEKIKSSEIYTDVPNSTAQIYTDLNIRHWDKWNEGQVKHVFLQEIGSSKPAIDILSNEPYDCPQQPFGGTDDFIFSPDSKTLVYVSKKKTGKAYYESTNTDIYAYHIATRQTENWSEGMMGYDVHPQFSPDGKYLAWLSMATDGYEADKNDIVVMDVNAKLKLNQTGQWDETVDGDFKWAPDGNHIYFTASIKGTQQLFQLKFNAPTVKKIMPPLQLKQITKGNHNINAIALLTASTAFVTKTDFNRPTEINTVDLTTGALKQITKVNDKAFEKIALSKSELKTIKTFDGKDMGVWVIYPPDFDPAKKYPTLLYCQGGPQSALSQFYSLRWNFHLMASQGYIIVAPNRRGMPGWGVAWNKAISGDWGGGAMKDYLTAIDEIAKESYVDKERIGAIGASYGGYSVFMLAGIHEGRFKTFIAHCGLFDMKSWYGTTEEMWFANWDLGGNYWDKNPPIGYTKFNPSNYIDKWNTPILIIQGALDFRVPVEQGLQAYKAAQLRGLKSKLLYFPNENHWVSNPHNSLVWHREFYKWLKETL